MKIYIKLFILGFDWQHAQKVYVMKLIYKIFI